MDNKQKLKFLYQYLHKQLICVLATVTKERKPEAASMAFSETESLEIIFQTPNTTRKYQNLKNNPHVAIVVGWDIEEYDTLQYEGIARELAEDERDYYSKTHVSKNPFSRKFIDIPGNKFFLVTPIWIRYTGLKTEPNKVIELELDDFPDPKLNQNKNQPHH